MDIQPGDRIRQLREAKHYTREKLADEVGITSKFLYEIEKGRRSFSAINLVGLAQALSVSCDYIMLGEQGGRTMFAEETGDFQYERPSNPSS